jgi:hypothetical protein
VPASKHLALVATALVAVAAPTTAVALSAPLKNDAAMRKGIRDFGRVEAHGAKASKLKISCGTATKVGKTVPCGGHFRLTLHGHHSDYQLTGKAATLRNSPGSVEYRLYARTAKKAPGLPTVIGGFSGFLQSDSNG